jgi:hypothetical protein
MLGCASFQPRPVEEVDFKGRAQTKVDAGVRVTAAVLSAEESKEVFGVDLYKKSIQPIWFEVENREKQPVSFLPGSVDRDYFTPLEVSHLNHFTHAKDLNQEMDRHFYDQSMGYTIGSNKVRSGFVFTHLDEGTKAFNVVVITENHQIRPFTFFIAVPGLKVDHSQVDWDNLYQKDEIVTQDEAGLRKALESLPCCVTGKDGKEYGDPLNLVIIGDIDEKKGPGKPALLRDRQGWQRVW